MNHYSLLAPIRRRGRLLAATAVIAALAMAMTVLPARAASAAPSAAYVAGNINSGFSQTGYPVGADCTATVGGWINNPYHYPGVGWVVSCSTVHRNISVWATLYVSGNPYVTTGRWVDYFDKRTAGPHGLVALACPGYQSWTVQLWVAIDGWAARSIDVYAINNIWTRQASLIRGPAAWTACT